MRSAATRRTSPGRSGILAVLRPPFKPRLRHQLRQIRLQAPLKLMSELRRARWRHAQCAQPAQRAVWSRCPATLESLSVLMTGRPREALVFTAGGGGPVDDVNFRNRVWQPAVAAAGIRRFPPRIMRHTAASWLVMDGVPLYDVQVLLGHESFATTQRYEHLAPDAHSRVIESWSRHHDASVTHGTVMKDA